jgi:predicted nucleic-acid-binding Zn-ribbon protein
MKKGHCPKCNAQEVHAMDGPYSELVRVPLGWTGGATTNYFICIRCGYVEIYIRNEADLPKIAEKLSKVPVSG